MGYQVESYNLSLSSEGKSQINKDREGPSAKQEGKVLLRKGSDGGPLILSSIRVASISLNAH